MSGRYCAARSPGRCDWRHRIRWCPPPRPPMWTPWRRRRHRPASRNGCSTRSTQRGTDFRAAQRRTWACAKSAAGEGHRRRRVPAGFDPRAGRCRGTDRQRCTRAAADRGDPPYWAPTVAADRFAETSTAERWHLLAATWLDLAARPALIGSRGPDAKLYAALSDSLYSTAAPLDRRLLLDMLAHLPTGAGVDKHTASTALIWRRPRWSRRLQPAPVADLLDEAHLLGLVGRGAISTPGRAFQAITNPTPSPRCRASCRLRSITSSSKPT